MNKSELSDLYRLLGKLKYELAIMISKTQSSGIKNQAEKGIDAINTILNLCIIDGGK